MTTRFRRIAAGLAAFAATGAVAAPALAQDGVSFTLGLGGQVAPDYFGSDKYSAGPTGKFSVNRFAIGSLQFGSPDPRAEKLGFGLRGAFRYIGARKAADHPELAGPADVKASGELGVGLGYEAADWRAFVDVRYGVVGHHATVAELGADWKAVKTDDVTVSIGPRLTYGSDKFVQTYFGVPAGAPLAAHATKGGLVSAGIEIGATYALSPDWSLEGTLAYERLQGDAATSPITAQGSRNQGSVSLVLTRNFSIRF